MKRLCALVGHFIRHAFVIGAIAMVAMVAFLSGGEISSEPLQIVRYKPNRGLPAPGGQTQRNRS
jgi:hypothetical protein